jgi:hypothetical protein
MRGGVNVGLEQIATSPISAHIAFPCKNILRNNFISDKNSFIQFPHRRKTALVIAGLFDYMQNMYRYLFAHWGAVDGFVDRSDK